MDATSTPPLDAADSGQTGEKMQERLTANERLAVWITQRVVGTMPAFYLILFFYLTWIAINLLLQATGGPVFDQPFGFVILLFLSNFIQLLYMPLISVGQNVLSRYAEMQAEDEYYINLRSEMKIQAVMAHLEQQDELIRELAQEVRALRAELGRQEASGPSSAAPS